MARERRKYGKKCTIVIILALLETESEYGNPYSQSYLARVLTSMGCPCDRKTVGRDISALISLGYPIKKTPRGYYMANRQISVEEAKLVLNSVKEAKTDLVDKDEFIFRLRELLGHKYSCI